MQDHDTVITFCKYPTETKVKTRIAETLGNKFAASIYKIFAEHTFRELLKTETVVPYLFFTEKNDKEKIEKWSGNKFILELQEGNDLGNRMYNAFKKVINKGSKKTIVIGTDIPDMSSNIIRNAMYALDNSDVVIGPSNDGGYYLLGMKKLYKNLFSGIEWSSESVLSLTLKKINTLNLSYTMLPELIDVDTEDDLKIWLDKDSAKKNNILKSTIRSFLLDHIETK